MKSEFDKAEQLYEKIIEKEGELNNKLHMMYAREVYKSDLDNNVEFIKNYFETELSKNIDSDDDYIRAHQSVAVLSKIYQKQKNDKGLIVLLWYLIGEQDFEETVRMIDRKYGSIVKIVEGVHKVEYAIAIEDRKELNISAELALNVGVRLREEGAFEDSKRWFLMAQDITRAILDVDSATVIPQRYIDMIDTFM
jgi:tetratricopeptide (TPR) repeat protein